MQGQAPITVDATLQRWIASTKVHLEPLAGDGVISRLKGTDFQGSGLALLRAEISGLARVLARNPPECLTIALADSGQCRGLAGRRDIRLMPKRLAFILLPGEVLQLSPLSPKLGGLLLQLPSQLLLEECQLHGTEDPDLLSLQDTIPGHEPLILVCAQQLLELAGQPESPARARMIQPLEASILSLLASLVASTENRSTPEQAPEPSQSIHVQNALAFIEEHLAEAITLTDLCRVCCVSARTLQMAFHAVMNRTPLQVLQEVRLTRLRELLLQGMDVRGASKLVGLPPTGRMAANYKRLFGELPSQTKP